MARWLKSPPPPLSASDHRARGLALPALHVELSGRRGTACGTGLDICYETVRCWVLKLGPMIARRLRQCRARPSNRWHLDEMMVRIAGERMYLWPAVDHECEVLDISVQRRRDTRAALRLMCKLLKKQGFAPKLLVTDKLRSYACAFQRRRLICPHQRGLRQNLRVLRPSVNLEKSYNQ
jgi:transposase-like protein